MTPIGIPSGWEMNVAACAVHGSALLAGGEPWLKNDKIDDGQSIVHLWPYWFLNGDHTIHPDAEC